jgi:hypothetical protein
VRGSVLPVRLVRRLAGRRLPPAPPPAADPARLQRVYRDTRRRVERLRRAA